MDGLNEVNSSILSELVIDENKSKEQNNEAKPHKKKLKKVQQARHR